MNKRLSSAIAATLRLAFLVVLLASPGVSTGDDRLTFAFAENAPPYSYSLDNRAAGLFPELVQLAFSFTPDYSVNSTVMPWSRAQHNVRRGLADGFLTYPSGERQDYAIFSAKPLFTQDFGHLVYAADNPNAQLIESASGFSDLADLKVIVEKGSKWEDENLPAYLERVPGRDLETMMHLLMLRKAGDFFVQPAEDARFIARKLGYGDRLKVRKVDFIPNALIPFHIGVSRNARSAAQVIQQVDEVMQTPEFVLQRNQLIERYR